MNEERKFTLQISALGKKLFTKLTNEKLKTKLSNYHLECAKKRNVLYKP